MEGRKPADVAMDRYAAGDDSAFIAVYDEVAPRLLAYLRRRAGGDEAAAEDLVQKTMLQIHRGRASFMPGGAVTPWAFAIARRLLIDKMRKEQRHVPIAREVEVSEAPPVTSGPATDDVLHTRRLADRVVRELERLPETQRAAFELVRQDGLSLAEAAEALGCTVPAVKSRMHRVYEELRRVFGDAFEASE